MKLKKRDLPDWWKKLDTGWMGLDLHKILDGSQQPPSPTFRAFLGYRQSDDNDETLRQLGVEVNCVATNLHTATIPYANLEQVAKLDFVKSIAWPKQYYPN